MDYRSMGRRIQELRKQQGLTQQLLAERIGVSTSYIGHIERGTRVLSLETFASLCSALAVDPADLLQAAGYTLDHSRQFQQAQQLLQLACRLASRG